MKEQKPPLSRNPRDPRSPGAHVESRGGGPNRAPVSAPTTVAPAVAKSGVPHGATESGWLPDCVYAGDKLEWGLAFFADTHGRITRFSREPADLASARRLAGQAAFPGLVNTHSHAFHRLARGRAEARGRDFSAGWRAALTHVTARVGPEEMFDVARLAFLEMLLAGITCVGEFHYLHHQPDGTAWPDPNELAHQIIRAAHEVGIRIALLKVLTGRGDFGADLASAPPRMRSASVDEFVRQTESLRTAVEKEFPADEVWLGVGPYSLGTVPLDALKALATYARAQRFRFHAHVSTRAEDATAATAEYGRAAILMLGEHGIVDKRFTAIDAQHLTDDEIRVLGTARASVCVCPGSERQAGRGSAAVPRLLAAGVGVAFGTDHNVQIDLLREARTLEYDLRTQAGSGGSGVATPGATLLHAATVTGARSLGATTGALDVGRPADFFTVNLFDPSIAGADTDTLLSHVLLALERRAIRDVWIGARQRISGGRHVNQGPIIGRFVELQKKIWGP